MSTSIGLQRSFNLAMTVVIAAIVFLGFSRTVDRVVFHPRAAPPWILYVHVALSSAWILLLVVQSALVWSRNVPVHRRLGVLGLVLGGLMSVTAFITAIDLRRIDIQAVDDVVFLIIPLSAFVTFTVPFVLAALWRKWPDRHRPLMLLAGIAATSPALARFPGVRPHLLFLTVLVPDLLVLISLVVDAMVRRRLSPVYGWGLAGLLATQIAGFAILATQPAWWIATARFLMSLPV